MDYDDYDDEPRRGGFPVALLAVVLILAFVGGLIWFLWNNFLNPILTPADTFEVPSLVGMTMEEIYADTEITDVWKIELSDNYVATDEYEYGQVARQEPSSGATVKENNLTIIVYLSSGEDDGVLHMPPVVGKEYLAAYSELAQMGLVVKRAEENSEDLPSGIVISTDPPMNTEVEIGQEVTIVVSVGPLEETTTVPQLEGQTLEQARNMIEQAELTLYEPVTEVPSDTVEEGRVVMQSLPAGDSVVKGTTIILQVSTGPSRPVETETPSPEPSPVTSPEVPPENPDDPVMAPETGLAYVTIEKLSQFEGSVQVQITVGGRSVHNQSHSASEGQPQILVEGAGTELVQVLYNGTVLQSYEQAFS